MQEQSDFADQIKAEFKEQHLKNVEEQRLLFEENKKKKGKGKKGGNEENNDFDEN